jgi:hypothetical protein
MTTAELQTKRDALVGRIADAVKSITTGDKSVTYADIAGMEKALAILDGELASSTGTRTNRALLIQHSNG